MVADNIFVFSYSQTESCLSAADGLASALDSLHAELTLEESRGLFLRYDGVDALTSSLLAGRGGLRRYPDAAS